MPPAPEQASEHSTIHDDSIWRQTIRKELQYNNNWESVWGFLKDGNNSQRPQAKLNENPYSSCLASKLGPGLVTGDPEYDSKLESFIFTYNAKRIKTLQKPIEKSYFPSTTAEQIGWQWNSPASKAYGNTKSTMYTLEKFGKLGQGYTLDK